MLLIEFLALPVDEQYKIVMQADLLDKLSKVYLLNLQLAIKQKRPALVQYNENLLSTYYKLTRHEATIKKTQTV